MDHKMDSHSHRRSFYSIICIRKPGESRIDTFHKVAVHGITALYLSLYFIWTGDALLASDFYFQDPQI